MSLFERIAGTTLASFAISISSANATLTTSPGTALSDVPAANLTISSQAPFASASVNLIPGNINLRIPAPVGAGANGYTSFLQTGTAASEIRIGYNLGGVYTNTETILGISGQLSIQAATSLALHSSQTYNDSGGLTLRSSGFASYFVFSTQIPVLASFGAPLGGLSTTPFSWSGQTSPNTVACGVGGTQTVSAAQAIIPFFLVTTGTLTSNAIVDFTTNAPTGYFLVNLVGVGTLGVFSLQFKNGSAVVSVTATALANLLATGANSIQIATYGANTLSLF